MAISFRTAVWTMDILRAWAIYFIIIFLLGNVYNIPKGILTIVDL
jgi:hypothetical protein